jgi:hypothetical protein
MVTSPKRYALECQVGQVLEEIGRLRIPHAESHRERYWVVAHVLILSMCSRSGKILTSLVQVVKG